MSLTRSRLGIFVFSLSILFIIESVSLFAQSEEEKCLAVITDIKGDVEVTKANNDKIEGYWGLQLFNGDRVKTARASSVALIFSNGSLVNLGANSNIEISGGNEFSEQQFQRSENVDQAMIGNFVSLALKKEKDKEVGVLAGLRSIGSVTPIEIISPCNTSLMTNTPSFEWQSNIQIDEFEVKLFNKDGLVWSKKVTDNKMDYPEDAGVLNFSETYFWRVEGESMLTSYKSEEYVFSILSRQQIEEITQQEESIKTLLNNNINSSSYHSILGAYYFDKGLFEKAIAEFNIVSEKNPNSAIPHEILGQIYSYMGEKDKAIRELKKALQIKE